VCCSEVQCVVVCCSVLQVARSGPTTRKTAIKHNDNATASNCRILQHPATHYNTLKHTATHCNSLQHTATHCNTMQHTATHAAKYQTTIQNKTLIMAATLCTTLQHTATHCNTHFNTLDQTPIQPQTLIKYQRWKFLLWLQHTATHCNTLCNTHCNTWSDAHPTPDPYLDYHPRTMKILNKHTTTPWQPRPPPSLSPLQLLVEILKIQLAAKCTTWNDNKADFSEILPSALPLTAVAAGGNSQKSVRFKKNLKFFCNSQTSALSRICCRKQQQSSYLPNLFKSSQKWPCY